MSQFSVVKDKLIEMTGREDLGDVGAVLNAAFFINEGQKFLDRLFNRGKTEARHFVNLTIGQILVPLTNVRSFKEVWLYDSVSRVPLIVEDQSVLRTYYNKPVASETAGSPVYYSPIVIRPYPKDLSSASLNQVWAVQDMKLTAHEAYNAILLMPPVDASSKYTLEIRGLFYTDTLVNDTDISYWTETNEILLLFASAYMLEISYRNTEGAKDWLGSITTITEGLDKDIVEEEITGISSMERKIWNTPS